MAKLKRKWIGVLGVFIKILIHNFTNYAIKPNKHFNCELLPFRLLPNTSTCSLVFEATPKYCTTQTRTIFLNSSHRIPTPLCIPKWYAKKPTYKKTQKKPPQKVIRLQCSITQEKIKSEKFH